MLFFQSLKTNFISASFLAGGLYAFENSASQIHDAGRPDPRVMRTIRLEDDIADLRPTLRQTHLVDAPEPPEVFVQLTILD